ncbi:MAG TPA: hypothetical protein VLE95_08640, partial [Chlamydiales bacterium]|nr:hypothetical protein [Chlamydiales bacterium]
ACSTSGPYAGTLIHEAGHAAAQKLLFQNCHPEIIVHADGSGFARYNYIPGLDWRKLTYFGENLIGDPIRAEGIVALMGPVADLVASCSTLALGLKASSKRPELSNYLLAHSYARIANLFSYAISPLFYSNLGSEHDFQSIRERLGIHPLAAAVTILALPILTYKVFAPKNESST